MDAGSFIAMAMLVLLCPGMPGCSPPDDSNPINVIGTETCNDPWRNDTARVRTTIRFEALVDTQLFPSRDFIDSGLRIALLLIPPPSAESSGMSYYEFHSYPADYLAIPAVSLALRADLPPQYFRQFDCARLAVAMVLLHRDENGDEQYQPGEAIVGACEQSLYAFAQGDVRTVPKTPFETLLEGSNIMIRSDSRPYPSLRSSPDYHATIFILNVRGEQSTYNIPLPWPGPALLLQ